MQPDALACNSQNKKIQESESVAPSIQYADKEPTAGSTLVNRRDEAFQKSVLFSEDAFVALVSFSLFLFWSLTFWAAYAGTATVRFSGA